MMARRLLLCLLGLSAFSAGCASEAVRSTTQPSTDPQTLRILFIGNSYTSFNGGMYRILPEMADQRGRTIECVGCVGGGKSLEWHWNRGRARQLIAKGGWDWVVLQDHSLQPLNNRHTMFEYARRFDAAIRQAGGKTALFVTWARQHRPQKQQIIAEAYTTIAQASGATLVPVGVAWRRALDERPKLTLHCLDGSHPTAEGTYLAACCFYVALLGDDPRGLPPPTIRQGIFPPRTLSADVTMFLQRVAWETVQATSAPAARLQP